MNTEQQYIKAFNNGYVLAQFEPVLLNTVSKSLPSTNAYCIGLQDGREQYQNEKTKEHLDVLGQIRTLRNQRGHSIEPDL